MRARDSWENTVDILGADFRVCAPADPDCEGAGMPIDGDETDGLVVQAAVVPGGVHRVRGDQH